MKNPIITLTPEAAQFTALAVNLIPHSQLMATIQKKKLYREVIERLNAQAPNIPQLGKADWIEEPPAYLHYYFSGTNIYVYEWDREDTMYGTCIPDHDLDMAYAGLFSLSNIKLNMFVELDYYFTGQTIAA
ncbi:hypothetical protein AGMMS49944_25300 [Spirochaetia bacterium]|nr:hypothetical protein AGMMS49944_25300 [Spirochaetia bacterium]